MLRHDKHTLYSFLAAWCAVVTCSFSLAAGITDGTGLQENEHAGSLPSGVAQPFNNTYVVENLRTFGTNFGGLCGPEETGSGVKNSAPIDTSKDSTLVVCENPQTWNVAKGASPDFSTSMERVVSSPFALTPAFLSLLGIGAWGTSKARQGRRRRRHEAEAAQARKQVRAEAATKKRDALVAAWSKADTDISDADFERRLAEIDREIERG